MPFSKQKSGPEVSFELRHPWHPGTVFVFTFPKELPQAALDKEKHFIGLADDERKDAVRVALIETVGAMVSQEPEGFEGFPGAEQVAALKVAQEKLTHDLKEDVRRQIQREVERLNGELEAARATPLAERFKEYFDDPAHPELESLVTGAWRAYRAASLPAAYLKSREGSGAAGRVSASGAG